MAEQTKDPDSALFRIAGVGTALAFGTMVASLFALRKTTAGFTFEINALVVIAFIVSAIMAWFYWRLVARMAMDKSPEQRKKKFVVFSVALLVVGGFAFAYPLRFIPPEKRADVFIGLALAIGVLTGVGFVMRQVIKFLNADQKRAEEEDRQG
jgi:heme/copper-type cytochrome/quinol oxidase subunit 3